MHIYCGCRKLPMALWRCAEELHKGLCYDRNAQCRPVLLVMCDTLDARQGRASNVECAKADLENKKGFEIISPSSEHFAVVSIAARLIVMSGTHTVDLNIRMALQDIECDHD